MKRFSISLAAAVVFMLAVFCDAWFFGGQMVFPLRPGEWIGTLIKRAGAPGGAGTYQVLFLVTNVAVWTFTFFALAALWTTMRRAIRRQ